MTETFRNSDFSMSLGSFCQNGNNLTMLPTCSLESLPAPWRIFSIDAVLWGSNRGMAFHCPPSAQKRKSRVGLLRWYSVKRKQQKVIPMIDPTWHECPYLFIWSTGVDRAVDRFRPLSLQSVHFVQVTVLLQWLPRHGTSRRLRVCII